MPTLVENEEKPVDYYATVWCENMADRSATSSTAIQGDVPSASESMEPADNPANSECDSDSNDSPVVSHVVSLLDRLKAPTPSGGNVQLQQQMLQYAVSCVQPGLLYFQECLN